MPLPAAFSEDLAAAVRDLPLNRYPDGEMTALRDALAARTGHPADGVWPANGSNEVLTQLLQAYGGPGRSAAVFEPTYLLHRRARAGSRRRSSPNAASTHRSTSGARTSRGRTTRASTSSSCALPTTPPGTAQTLDTIAGLAAATDALVIVDEAYMDFGGESALPLVADHANVAVVRTFSKAFALAGARIGYVLASPTLVEDLRRVRLPYHLSALTQAAGLTALRHADEAAASIDAIREQRDRLVEALSRIDGATVFPSQANFVLFQPPGDAKATWQALLDRGVLIRDLSGVVPNALRVTAGTAHEVDLFLKSLEEVLA